jgi:hypothetical protein
MKIEFIQESKVNGDIVYFTNIDGRYVTDSLSLDKKQAYAAYQRVIANKGKYALTQVLESIEIDRIFI